MYRTQYYPMVPRVAANARNQIAISIFYPFFLLVHIPSNLIIRAWRPSIWIPTLMLGWATVTTLTGVVQSFAGLLVARSFLGLAQGGVFPGLVYLYAVEITLLS